MTPHGHRRNRAKGRIAASELDRKASVKATQKPIQNISLLLIRGNVSFHTQAGMS